MLFRPLLVEPERFDLGSSTPLSAVPRFNVEPFYPLPNDSLRGFHARRHLARARSVPSAPSPSHDDSYWMPIDGCDLATIETRRRNCAAAGVVVEGEHRDAPVVVSDVRIGGGVSEVRTRGELERLLIGKTEDRSSWTVYGGIPQRVKAPNDFEGVARIARGVVSDRDWLVNRDEAIDANFREATDASVRCLNARRRYIEHQGDCVSCLVVTRY